MSPRAAWRLEALGYREVYDYVAGKADWLAAGMATEGALTHRPRVIDVVDRSMPTCRPGEPVADALARMTHADSEVCVVINDHRVVQGRLRRDRIDGADRRPAEEVMESGPATIRADADVAATIERMGHRGAATLIVSTPEGVLLGVVHIRPQPEAAR